MKGYFRKRGTKWSFSVDIGKDPATGKRKQKTASGFKTKKEAEKACALLITEIENGSYIEETKDNLHSLIEEWLEKNKTMVNDSTFYSQKQLVNKRIVPVFGKSKITEIKAVDIQRYYNNLLDEGLSPGYIHRIHSILLNVFETAYKWELIKKNIMENVERPKKKETKTDTWTIENVQVFLAHLKGLDSCYYIFTFLAVFTGMRRGEILGLKWEDIDMEKGTIHVQRNLVFVPVTGHVFHEGKTKTAKRSISISSVVIDALKKHKVEQNKKKLIYGLEYKNMDLVVCKDDGDFLHGRVLSRRINNEINKLNLPPIRIHDFRHTHATIMLKLGEHPKIVSERLGHSNIKMTLDRYSHVTTDMQKEASERFEKAFKKL